MVLGILLFILLRQAGRRFHGSHKVVFQFIIFAYLMTYYIGACVIFVFGEDALLLYFSPGIYLSSTSDNAKLFFLCQIPFFVAIAISLIFGSRFNRELQHAHLQITRQESSFGATFLTAIITITFSLAVLGNQIPGLLENSLSFGNILDVGTLYFARGQAFSNINFVRRDFVWHFACVVCRVIVLQWHEAKINTWDSLFRCCIGDFSEFGTVSNRPVVSFSFLYVVYGLSFFEREIAQHKKLSFWFCYSFRIFSLQLN